MPVLKLCHGSLVLVFDAMSSTKLADAREAIEDPIAAMKPVLMTWRREKGLLILKILRKGSENRE